MNIHISFDSELPMYEQIEEQIKEAICNNLASDNEPLPSVRQLSARLNVSAITIKRAYADLEREGFIYTVAGKGTFVRLKQIEDIKNKYMAEQLKDLRNKLNALKKTGISREDISSIVDEIFSDGK
ncbi:MAG: GntR family transcriptional regulator [Lachnospiraceae bacterium]|nr:GntR family transcriptional regulator [Lachnospiraceae bacterium]